MLKNINSIAVLMACHNRREKTLTCLRSLFAQINPDNALIQVYLVDDGSIDGTMASVAEEFPQVNIIQGDGTLYWCGGMRLAWEEAQKLNYDAYLWLNDDVKLFDRALSILLRSRLDILRSTYKEAIIIGACMDQVTHGLIYGGFTRDISKGILGESDNLQKCYTMNGNIVLIPDSIFKSVGNFSSVYTHAMGDIDYGIRASKKNFNLYIAPGVLGECERNPEPKWTRSDVPFIERVKIMQSPKGLPPIEYMLLRRQCGLKFWFLIPIKLYFRVCFPFFWE